MALILKAGSRNLPIPGVCLGAQFISKALGGSVYPGEDMEIGWHSIEAVNATRYATNNKIMANGEVNAQREQAWLTGLPVSFEVAHTFTVPPGATPLWHSHCYEQQGFARGRVLAMQFHLEVTADSIVKLSQHYAGDLSQPSDCVQSAARLTDNLIVRTKQLHQLAD